MKGTILVSGVVSSLVSITGTVVALNVLAPAVVEAQETRIRAENVTVVDGSGTTRANMSTGPGARSDKTVRSVEGAPRVSMNTGGSVAGGGTQPDMAGVFIFTPEAPGTPGFVTVARLTSQPSGQVGLSLGRGDQLRVSLQADADGTPSRMTMRDENGNIRILLVVAPDGTPRIQLLDASGNITWSAQ